MDIELRVQERSYRILVERAGTVDNLRETVYNIAREMDLNPPTDDWYEEAHHYLASDDPKDRVWAGLLFAADRRQRELDR